LLIERHRVASGYSSSHGDETLVPIVRRRRTRPNLGKNRAFWQGDLAPDDSSVHQQNAISTDPMPFRPNPRPNQAAKRELAFRPELHKDNLLKWRRNLEKVERLLRSLHSRSCTVNLPVPEGIVDVHREMVTDSLTRLFDTGTLRAHSESQLLEQFITRGDEAAFESILLRHGPMVLRVCGHVLDNPHDVDDAFQATFLILVKKARTIRDRDVLGTWLYGVARRVAVRARTSARRRRTLERAALGEVREYDDHATAADTNEIRALVDQELERLPERYRAPLILCDLEGQTHEEAAARIGCPVGTVKSRLSRGRDRLKGALTRRGLSSPGPITAPLLVPETVTAVPGYLLSETLRGARQLIAGGAVAGPTVSTELTQLMKGALDSMSFSRIEIVAAGCLAVLFTAVAAVPAFVTQAPGAPGSRQKQAAAQDQAAKKSATAPDRAARTPERGSERYQLDNGLTVILRPIAGAKSTDLIVLYSIGCDHDPAGQSGLSHLVEHVYLMAKAGEQKARTIAEFLQRYPEGANGQTGDRYTVFSTAFSRKVLDAELKDAAARMGNLVITAADIERERPRLLHEINNMFGGIPALGAINNARELVRPTAHGGRKGGLPDQVKAITPDQVQAFWQRYYKPRNAILALAGDLDTATARKSIADHFGKLAAGEQPPAPNSHGQPQFGTSRELAVTPVATDAEPTACLAYAAPAPGSELYVPFLVLVTRMWATGGKLGSSGPMGSPVYFTPFDDGTIVALFTSMQPGETGSKACARIESFVAETVAPKLEEMEKAGARDMLGMMLGTGEIPDAMLANNPYGVIFSIGRREQLGIDPEALDKAFKAVTDQDLRRAAKEVFGPDRHAGVIVTIKK
jgi:zinc protease